MLDGLGWAGLGGCGRAVERRGLGKAVSRAKAYVVCRVVVVVVVVV